MAKYKVGDVVVLTADMGGKAQRIAEVLPEGGKFQYVFIKPGGYKRYGLNDSNIAGLYGEVDPRNLPTSDGYDHAKAQALAMKEATRTEGTPTGDRWLLLATLNVGDNLTICDALGNRHPATLVKLRMDKKGTRLLACPFVAKNYTGGVYMWRLDDLFVPK